MSETTKKPAQIQCPDCGDWKDKLGDECYCDSPGSAYGPALDRDIAWRDFEKFEKKSSRRDRDD